MSSSQTAVPTADATNLPLGLVARVAHIPLVKTAILAYEKGKASSYVVKYGAEMVESSVKTLLKPLIRRLPVSQVDQFVCRQLDKVFVYHGHQVDEYRSPYTSSTERSSSPIRDNLKSRESAEQNAPRWLKVPGMKPHMAPVPVIPDWITGPCVYGHIITDDHRDHFRRMYPDIAEWESCDPEGLVDVASAMNHEAGYHGGTTKVYDRGQWHTCLVHIDYRPNYPNRDRRRTMTFMAALEKALGITGEPIWYPCYSR